MLNASNALESAKRKALEAPYIVYFAALVLVAFLADPYSFARSWNEGRSAMLAIVPLVFLEAGKGSLFRLHGRRKPLVAWLTLGVAAAFYFAVSQRFVVDSIVSFGGKSLGVDPTTLQFSWVWAIDYTVWDASSGGDPSHRCGS